MAADVYSLGRVGSGYYSTACSTVLQAVLLFCTVMQNMPRGGSYVPIAGSHQLETKSLCFGLAAMYANFIIHLQKFILGLKTTTDDKWLVLCKCEVSYQHMCIAQTCNPSTSSLHASLCGSHAPYEQPPFPLRWYKVSPWTWWPPAASPPGSRREWSAAWWGARATSQSRPRQHWEEQELDGEENSLTGSTAGVGSGGMNHGNAYHGDATAWLELTAVLFSKTQRRRWSSLSLTASSRFT